MTRTELYQSLFHIFSHADFRADFCLEISGNFLENLRT